MADIRATAHWLVNRALDRLRVRGAASQGSTSSRDEHDDDAGFEMANLHPRTTGLPRTVWVSQRMGGHDIRIKVSTQPGDRFRLDHAVTVALRPTIREVGSNELSAAVMRDVRAWLALNENVLVAYWEGTIDTADLIHRLKRIESQ